jgi:hypothetical protein
MPNANWANPTLASLYTNFVTEVKARDEDLALQFDGTTATAFPTNTIRWSSSANRWQKWSGSAWGELTTTYALTGLSTTGAAAIGGNLSVTGTSVFTGIPTAPTAATGTNTTQLATTAHVFATAALLAPLASPTFTGNVLLPSVTTVAAASQPVLRIQSNASGSWKSNLLFSNSGTAKWEIGVDYGAAGDNNLYFYDNAAALERARFTPFGYLKCAPTGSASYVNISNTGTYHEFHSTTQPLILRNTTSTTGKWWYVGPDNSSNGFTIYNQTGSTGVFITDGANAWSSSSDERLKDIIEPISGALAKVSGLRAVIGKFKTDPVGIRRSFLIAQDVQAVLPEAISVKDDSIQSLGLAYTDVIPLLAAALKEALVRIEALEAQVTTLQAA